MPDERKAPKVAQDGGGVIPTGTELRDRLDQFMTLGSPQYERFRDLDALIKQRSSLDRQFGRLLGVLLHFAELHIEIGLAPGNRSQLLGALQTVDELYKEHGALHPETVQAVKDLRMLLFPEG